MDAAQASTGQRFDAPGPGSWVLDAVHVPRPFSAFQGELHPPHLAEGFRDSFRRYGLLIDTLDYRMVNGFAYFQVLPAPADEIPARLAAAEQTFATRRWRADLEAWRSHVKPASIRAHLALQAIDPATLSDVDLLTHLATCRAHLGRMVRQHHSFNAPALLSVGDLMAHLGDWTDVPLGAAMAALRGAAPESAGRLAELDDLVAALRHSATARQILDADDEAGAILSRLRGEPGEVGRAAAAYLDLVGYRLLDSLDTAEPFALEVPSTLLAGIRHAVADAAPMTPGRSHADAVRLRDRVPDRHRDRFDDLLAEARLMSPLRDERGLYSDVWAAGITRRVILEAGARLAAAGRLRRAADLAEGTFAEIQALIAGAAEPSADELARRADYRARARAGEAPPALGEPAHPPPPLDGLPPAAARAMRAVDIAINAVFAPSMAAHDTALIRGTGASPGVYRGRARVLGGPSEFGRLRHGDVLVTATTTEAFNIVLPLLGALVTDTGGLLSHAAIVAREYGLPSVVGTRDATARIPDGADVEVNGAAGEVRVLAT